MDSYVVLILESVTDTDMYYLMGGTPEPYSVTDKQHHGLVIGTHCTFPLSCKQVTHVFKGDGNQFNCYRFNSGMEVAEDRTEYFFVFRETFLH